MKNSFRKVKLPSGLRVILVPMKGGLNATCAVLVEAGSKYETKDINGLSHFLEHMCFKGTTNRPGPKEISAELDGLGAQYNAFTSREFTSYYAKVRSESLPKALEIIADMYLNPIFDAKEIEKERGVIIEEINMYEDTPKRKVGDLFMELVYGDQPAGWDIAGRKEVIERLTREDFIKYRSENYLAPATVVVVAGNFDPDKVQKEVEIMFAGLGNGRKKEKPKVVESQSAPRELIHFKESDQTHLVMGFRAFPVFDERRFTLNVLTDILGGGMSSRLFTKVRDELGAAYYVGASADLYSDHGLAEMVAGVNHKKIEDVIKASLEEFARFRDELVPEPELARAKEHILGNFFLSLETTDEVAFYYGSDEIMGLPIITPEEVAEKIRRVTAEDIRAVARDLFRNEGLNLAVIGPFRDKSFGDILKV